LRGRLGEIKAAGGELVLIGNGSPRQAAGYQRLYAPDCTVLTDPTLEVYRALGLKRGVMATMGPSTWVRAARSLAGGHVQGELAGDAWQQGGLFVMAPGGRLVFEQRNRDAATRPDIEGALRALRKVGPG
jgi:uncharacterized protein YjhX (UPF0386 family)